MIDFPLPLRHLIAALRQLPSIGPRSAERLALHILNTPHLSHVLMEALKESEKNLCSCKQCGFFADQELCEICRHPNRTNDLLCVVQSSTDVLAFEKTGVFRGLYHVIHGTLSPLDGIGPEELSLSSLFERVEKQQIREVILGLNLDVRGETTSLYLSRELKNRGVVVTRLATGIAVGSGLEFADSLTLTHALTDRKPL